MITASDRFSVPLIKTKLSAPQLRAGLVARPHLLLQLQESAGKPFLLICAPAGYGKTTLLVNWIADLKRLPGSGLSTICWLSLGEGDNEPIRFLSYLIASFESAGIAISAEAHTLLQSTTPPPLQTVLAVLINDLGKLNIPIFLALDDYQFISNTDIHAGVTFFLEHLPSNVHLVIATRSDPPIPLARLRARGQMTEIRANDLRFSYAETDCLFNQLMDLGLTQEDTIRLEDRTEGWIVGLQMAALALKGISQTDYSKISLFVKNFSGSNRYILDYLVEEVLNQQPQEIQDFLLQTSILENLSGSLCDTLTGFLSRKSAEEINGQKVLEYLERTNLFLVALDSDRQWFRYHHLFASLLRSRLRQSMEALKIQELYCRASQWYESKGYLAEAISQALLSPDLTHAGEILERRILPFFYQSEITQVHQWLELLPEPLILQHPLLCAVHAATIALLPPYPPKSLPTAEKWMRTAEQGLSTALQCGDRLRTFIYNIRAYWAYFRSEPPEVVLQLISNASALLPADQTVLMDPSQLFIRSALQTLTGLTYWAAGEDQTAEQAFILARHYSSACNDLLNETASIIKLIEISCLQGRLEEGASICRKALAASERPSAYLRHRTPHSAFIGIQLAEILIEQKKLEVVEQLLQENIKLARWNESHDVMLRGHLDLARLAAMQGDPSAAFEYLNEAEKISEVGAGLAAAHRANLWLTLGLREPQYIELARQWGQNCSLAEFKKCPPQMEWIISLVLARLYLAEAELDLIGRKKVDIYRLTGLLAWSERQKQAMQARGWAHYEIQLCVIECLTYRAMGDTSSALAALRHALELAAPNEYISIFVEEGERLHRLLTELEKDAGWLLPYIRRLELAFPDTSGRLFAPPGSGSGWAERLTDREIEVLHAMGEGLSNQQIAAKFILAEGTVKFYVHAVLEKLGVHNRTQAVVEAKKLKII